MKVLDDAGLPRASYDLYVTDARLAGIDERIQPPALFVLVALLVQHRVEVGRELFGSPALPIRFGHHARKLAIDVRPLGEAPDVRAPGFEHIVFDARLGDVIQDEHLIGMAVYEGQRLRKMALVNQNVVDQADVPKRAYAPVEIVSQNIVVVGIILQNMAQSLELRTRGELFDFYPEKIAKGAIRPGTVIYDPNGHVAVVYSVDDDGRIRFIDTHPDNLLANFVGIGDVTGGKQLPFRLMPDDFAIN